MPTISLNKIVIVESLPQGEFHTGSELAHYLQPLLEERPGMPLSVDLWQCPGRVQFLIILDRMLEQVASGFMPWLHIDAHGDHDAGICFRDGTEMAWSELCSRLARINQATKFQLVVVVSACEGASIVSGMHATLPAPCALLLGPTATAHPGELLNRWRTFYRGIIETFDLAHAYTQVMQEDMEFGAMYMKTAEGWWSELFVSYLDTHASRSHAKNAALVEYRRRKAAGQAASLGQLKRQYWENLPSAIQRQYDRFFMLDAIPANREQFADLQLQLTAVVEKVIEARGRRRVAGLDYRATLVA